MERSAELVDLYRQSTAGNLRSVPAEQLTSSSDANSIIGTDPAEFSTDRASILRMWDAKTQAEGQEANTTPSDPQAWAEGDLGWVVDRPQYRMPNGATIQLRTTTIFHRENGAWKRVHQHAYGGVPNDTLATL